MLSLPLPLAGPRLDSLYSNYRMNVPSVIVVASEVIVVVSVKIIPI
jgi:hypothetical protein